MLRLYINDLERPVTVWQWDDAPAEYRALSTDDDEEYVALVPAEYHRNENQHPIFEFLHQNGVGAWFAPCRTEVHGLDNGDTVYIGYHA